MSMGFSCRRGEGGSVSVLSASPVIYEPGRAAATNNYLAVEPRKAVARDPGSRRPRVWLQPSLEGARIHGAGGLRHRLALREDDHRRDAADAVAAGQRRLLVGVDLEEPEARLERLGGALEGRRHGPAGAAPGGPEIDYDRDL